MTMDLSGVHPYRLRRDAEAHVLGERSMFLFITVRRFWPPHYRPRRERSCREGKEEHRILSTDGCDVRKGSTNAPIGGTVAKPANQNDRVSRSRGGVTFTKETGSRDRCNRWEIE